LRLPDLVTIIIATTLSALAGCGARSSLETACSTGPAADSSSSGGLVLFGGGDDAVASDDTWRFDGTSWTRLSPAHMPPRRTQATMAPLDGQLVLTGGTTLSSTGDVWIWSGEDWRDATPATPPVARYGGGLVAWNGGLLLSGGLPVEPGAPLDTWTLAGTTWTDLAGSGIAAGYGVAMGTLNGQVFAFGGENDSFNPTAQTRLWDGVAWTALAPAHSPPARRRGSMCAFGGKLVLFGGDQIGGASGTWESMQDTWLFDGTDWTQAMPSSAPPARSMGGYACTSAGVVMFGGSAFAVRLFDDTWVWDGTSWTQLFIAGPSARFGAVLAGM
jgi:hypothetical protein